MQTTQTLRRRFIRYKIMVLVLDTMVSERALALRKKVLQMGLSCAVSFSPFIVAHLRPIACLLTFQDVAEQVRPPLLSDVPMLALGEGFVSRMLNVQLFPTEALLLAQMEEILYRSMGWQRLNDGDKRGIILGRGFTMMNGSLHYLVYKLPLTVREKHIFMTILTSKEQQNSCRRIEAYSFPYPYHENGQVIAEDIATHISNINRKTMRFCHRQFIRYDGRGQGRYILIVP